MSRRLPLILLVLLFAACQKPQPPTSQPKVATAAPTKKPPPVFPPSAPRPTAQVPAAPKPDPYKVAEAEEEDRLADLKIDFDLLPADERERILTLRDKIRPSDRPVDLTYPDHEFLTSRRRWFNLIHYAPILVRWADKHDVDKFLDGAELTGLSQEAAYYVKLDFALLPPDVAYRAVAVAANLKKLGAQSLNRDDAEFVQRYKYLFYPKKLTPK